MKSLKEGIKKVKRPVRVIQFGTGNFLRGFADWMIDIMNESTDFNSSVHIVQIHGKTIPQAFINQDYNYHLLTRGISHGEIIDEKRIITCLSGITNANLDYSAYLDLSKLPDLRFMISNTTEAGIVFEGEDLIGDNNIPITFPGKLTAFLNHRFEVFEGDPSKGLILMPCELIEKNGDQLKSCILKYAELWHLSEDFIKWIENYNIFCNTLVDRIVPGMSHDNIQEIRAALEYEDELTVIAEPFHLWVIEGPAYLEKSFPAVTAGLQVLFVNDLSRYRTRKVRILNGAHTAMVPLAYREGFRTVRESVEDPEFGKLIKAIIFEEINPTLDLPKEELEAFANDVLERFRNPFIRHELISIALNSVSKFKVRVLPSLLEFQKRKGYWPKNLIASFAALIQFYSGKFKEEPIPLKDDGAVLKFFEEIWQENDLKKIVSETLKREDFWGEDLSKMEGLTEVLVKDLEFHLFF